MQGLNLDAASCGPQADPKGPSTQAVDDLDKYQLAGPCRFLTCSQG